MSQNELQPLHYRKAYALLIERVERVITQLECGGEDVPPAFICAALVQHCTKRRMLRVRPDDSARCLSFPSAVLWGSFWGGIFAVISRLHGAKDRLHAARPEGSKWMG